MSCPDGFGHIEEQGIPRRIVEAAERTEECVGIDSWSEEEERERLLGLDVDRALRWNNRLRDWWLRWGLL